MHKKLKSALICVLALITVMCSVMLTVFATESLTLENASSLDGMEYGQTVALPEGTLRYGTESKAATVTVEYPDGRKTGESTLKLDVEGIYTVIYSAKFGGEEKTEKKTFTVKKNLYHVSGNSSVVTLNYTYKYSEHSSETVPNYGENSTDDQNKIIDHMTNLINSSVSGLSVSLASGDVFEYGKVINLKDIPSDNKNIFENIISLVVTPDKIGTKDVEDFSIILTDAYDSSNYITVNVKATAGDKTNSIVYTRAAASNGQQFTGFAWNSTPAKKYVNNQYGTVTRMNFAGFDSYSATYNATDVNILGTNSDVRFGYDSIAKNVFSLAFDYDNRAIYNYTSSHSKVSNMIVDFDDPTHFEKLWSGFTTGECFLSIKGGTYVGNSFNFVITELFGQDISSDSFDDRGTLSIEAKIDDYAENDLPKALVGTPYKIFDATCTSPYYGELNVVALVEGPDGNVVTVIDGKFTPTAAGEYKIVYSVADYLGFTGSKTFTVNAVTSLNGIVVTLNGEYSQTGIAGVYVELVSDVTANGGSGNLVITYAVSIGEEKVEIKNGKFFPTKAGTYKVTVTATDYIEKAGSESYDVVIGKGDKPVYIDTPTLPKYFVSGKTYTLPALTAYDYTDGSGNAVKTKIAYIDGEGIKNAVGTTITPVANEIKDTVTIIYYTKSYDSEGNVEFYDIPVVNAWENGKIDVTKLFYSDSVTAKATLSYVTLSTSANSECDFVNKLSSSGLSVTFKGKKGASFEAFTITVTDAEDLNRQVRFMYSPKDGKSSYFRVNDLSSVPYEAGQSISAGEDSLTLTLDAEAGTVAYDRNSASVYTVDKYLNGEKFEGFGELVYVSFGFEGVDKSASVDIYNISGAALSSRTADRSAPNISISGSYLGDYSMGATAIRIPRAIVTDVLDTDITCYVTVQTPENAEGKRAIVTSVDGVYLNKVSVDRDYYIKGVKCGGYLVTFRAEDGSGNAEEYAYFINVTDDDAPVITLSGDVLTGKIGERITIPTATAKDAIDGEVDVIVFVSTPSGMIYTVKDKANEIDMAAFKPDRAGVYRIIYKASDKSDNMAVKTIEITVK